MNISGVTGKTVTLVWTNTSSAAASGIASTASVVEGDSSAAKRLHAITEAGYAKIRETLANPPVLSAAQIRASKVSAAYVTGDTHSWYDAINGTPLATTLRSQVSLSNGQKLNLWVQDSEWGSASFKVTQAMVDTLATRFATPGTGIFDLTTKVAGDPWGTTSYTNLISASQDINIVVTNFVADSKAGGLLGYFYGLNNFLKASGATYATSNEALVFFVDSESLASPNSAYQEMMASTLAHEFTHMINFYQRNILRKVSFKSWLEEISAMMMEDLLNPKTSSSYNNTLQSRIPGWLSNGINNCDVTEYNDTTTDACFSYNIGGSYGAFLLRQYGLGFYQDLLKSTDADGVTALDKTIKAYDSGSSFATSVARWGASIALLDSSMLPSGYGYPKKSVSLAGTTGWDVPAINGPTYKAYRKIASPLPGSLKGYAHSAQVFTPTGSTFTSTVTIPAGTTLTVVVN